MISDPKEPQNQVQLYISRTDKEFVCSCPSILPSYVVRGNSPEEVQTLMVSFLKQTYLSQNFSLPNDISFNVRNQKTRELQIFFVECYSLLPNYRTFSSNSPQEAANHLDHRLSEHLCKQNQLKEPIKVKIDGENYRAYHDSVQDLTPSISSNSKEEAYNNKALEITNQFINDTLMQQMMSPIIIIGAPHSGTSALALLLMKNEISMGKNLNYAFDETRIADGKTNIGPFKGLNDLVKHYYPDHQLQLTNNEILLLREFFFHLVKDIIAFPFWGWKTPVNTYLIPLFSKIFNKAKFLHIVRDGRDVTLSPHSHFPNDDFSKLLYFNETEIDEWQGISLNSDLGKNLFSNKSDTAPTNEEYKLMAYLWTKWSMLGHEYGKSLGKNQYHLVKFEDLCLNPKKTVRTISEFLDIPLKHDVMEFREDRVGKFKNLPQWSENKELIQFITQQCGNGLKYFDYSF